MKNASIFGIKLLISVKKSKELQLACFNKRPLTY